MSEIRSEKVKNIGDAGDSSRDEVEEDSNSPVSKLVVSMKRVLQCGNHQELKIHLGTLEEWRRQHSLIHDYWRVAQYIGETELSNICLLLTITFEKPESIKWGYLGDVLCLLAMALSNREAIFRFLQFSNSVLPILVEAISQQVKEDARLSSLTIITVTVCRARFAQALVNCYFLSKPLENLTKQGNIKSSLFLEKVLKVLKSLLLCGETCILNYVKEIFYKLSNVMQSQCDNKQLLHSYQELLKSVHLNRKPQLCAKYWMEGRLQKELLSQCLGQPWLYIYCSWSACGNHNGTPNKFFRKCSACGAVRYCSRQCQEKHWCSGHSTQCKLIAKSQISK